MVISLTLPIGRKHGSLCHLRTATLILFVAHSLFTQAHAVGIGDVQNSSTNQAGTLTVINDKGLQINGSDLIGVGVERPDSVTGRSAEQLADKGDSNGELASIKDAVTTWKRIADPYSPVGYLRRTADKYRTKNPDLAAYCDGEIARCYIEQGDSVSGMKILASYTAMPLNSEVVARVQAMYARELLSYGRFDEAAKIAKAVKAKFYNDSMTYDLDDACAIAVSVLMVLPTSGHETASNDKASEQTQKADANPRFYYELGQSALYAGNRTQAIAYWQEFRKRLPNDAQARIVANQIAEQYVLLNNIPKALDAYKDAWTSYPDFPEGWKARIAASKLQEKNNQLKEAQAQLAEGFDKTSTAEGKASILARQAEVYISGHQADEAVECYLTLLNRYGDQNAARDAYKNLTKQTTQVKDWRRVTNEIKNWLIGTSTDVPGKYGNTTLNLVGRSQLRRLALAFFVLQNDPSGAGTWLQSVGFASDALERQAVIRDEAWLGGQVARNLNGDLSRVTYAEIDNAIRLGLHGWEIAPTTDEGIEALKAACQLAVRNPNRRSGSIRDAIRELEDLRGTSNDELAKQLLLPLYEVVGDKKAVQGLQQAGVDGAAPANP
jgi:tetratricopeptide (TPR) repeat protein